MSTERKFARNLKGKGSAQKAREAVSEAIRERSFVEKPDLIEPLDYEGFIQKNRTLLQNDPHPNMLLFPKDDVSEATLNRRFRTAQSSVSKQAVKDATSLLVRECIKSYTTNWAVIHYKYNSYAGTYSQLPSHESQREAILPQQVFEVDVEDVGNKEDVGSRLLPGKHITKQGWLYKGPENENNIIGFTKTSKKRYFYLTQQQDATFVMEYHKDEKKHEAKGSVFLDSAVSVKKSGKRGNCFVIHMQDKSVHTFSTDAASEADEWMKALTKILQPAVDKQGVPFKEELSEHGSNLELRKYNSETENILARCRKNDRQKVFHIYPRLQKAPQHISVNELGEDVDVFRESFGTRFIVHCEEFKTRLQANVAEDGHHEKMDNPEPFFLTLALYDAKEGRKISEDFNYNPNSADVQQMIPSNIQITGQSKQAHHVDYNESAKQCIFSVMSSSADIFLVAQVSKVLHGSIASAAENYTRTPDPRIGAKLHKSMRVYCNRLGQHRMPIAWGARPVFKPFSLELDTYSDFALYKQDATKVSTEEIIKHLQEFRKPEKQSKWIPFLASLKVHLNSLDHKQVLSTNDTEKPSCNTLTSSLLPVKCSRSSSGRNDALEHRLTLEVEEFPPDRTECVSPFVSYNNHLYIYPQTLKYENQKAFAKARNICCRIEVHNSDSENAQPIRCIYTYDKGSMFATSINTPVLHHDSSPEFNQEVKILLPTQLHDKHHLLFTFVHVSCEIPKTSNKPVKKINPIETVVGYAWFPVLASGRVNVGEQNCRVAMSNPPGYLQHDHAGHSKGVITPDVKWVDGGKSLFKFNAFLRSSIYTQDQHLHNFFSHCDKIETMPKAVHLETNNILKSLHAVDRCMMIQFLPTLFNQLFRLLTVTEHEEVAINAVKVLIHGVTEIEGANRAKILKSYVKYVFVHELIASQRNVHEELALQLKAILRPTQADFLVTGKFMKYSWFFFEILIKSMAQHLLVTGRIKMARNERFPSSFQYHIQTLVQTLTTHIVQKSKDSQTEADNANKGLANFIKKCFTYMDRGFVFKLINKYIDCFNFGDSLVLYKYKFEFLTIISDHEHFIPLNLPLMRKHIKNYKDLKQDYLLSQEFREQHFMIGLLLHELKMALNEKPDIRQLAIVMIRNLLAKHSFDDRYTSKSEQSRIVMLYLPLVTIILEMKHRFDKVDGSHNSVQSSPIHQDVTDDAGSISEYGSIVPNSSYTSMSSLDTNSIGGSTLGRDSMLSRESAVFNLISGTGQGGSLPIFDSSMDHRLSFHGSNSSLASSSTLSSQCHTMDSKDAKLLQAAFNQQKSLAAGNYVSQLSLATSVQTTGTNLPTRDDKFTKDEVKDLLISFIYIIKNLAEEVLLGWFSNSTETDILDFFSILETAMDNFKYMGRKRIASLCIIGDSKTSQTLPANRSSASMQQYLRTGSLHSEPRKRNTEYHAPTESEAGALHRTMLEANLSSEVALVVLDIISIYCNSFKEQLSMRDGENALMEKLFKIYMSFLQNSQSEAVQKHTFAALGCFIRKFPRVLFKGDADMCGQLCYEILRCCNSRLAGVRNEACGLMYSTMKQNFEFMRNTAFTRVHLQMIISVSRLISKGLGLTHTRFHDSLSVINLHASRDKSLQRSIFPGEVKDLTRRMRTVLMATAQMRDHQNDPEMLIDLQYQLAKSYATTPELRKTWLDSMAKIHIKNKNFSEASHCVLHICALISEYLKRKGCFPQGCSAFKQISPNVEPEEGGMKDDSGMQDVTYTEDHLTDLLEECAKLYERAERYEVIGLIYKMIIPIYERKRNFRKLQEAYHQLDIAYSKIVEVMDSGKRMLGNFFRVTFYGQVFFEKEDGKEYIYKEPKITSLPEICERLKLLYNAKFGKPVVKLIPDSKRINPDDLEEKYAYIQVTYVTPYFDERELEDRCTEFERSNNVRRFMYETPFTKNGASRGEISEQYKRRTILTTSHAFPYVKKRIMVVYHREEELSPIEVAIDAITSKVADLQSVVEQAVPDLKKLQLRLQGSVSVQVNAGPMAYAEAFLSTQEKKNYKKEKVEALKNIFREFVQVCRQALTLNNSLITSDQFEYHKSLCANFYEMTLKLSDMFNEKLYEDDRQSSISRRSSVNIGNNSVVSLTNNTTHV